LGFDEEVCEGFIKQWEIRSFFFCYICFNAWKRIAPVACAG